ncbi:MAG: bifunctional acetate--CoA ligase family protein/GNAT family N-acetyltransferase [Saprospiraceae bacterium]|nr:bifunctional acetate--CoA ligase family protein/GNAT family N-acetyltransferase [Saprospiraceae bacterium]
MRAQLEKFFKPNAIALIGASDKEGSLGWAVLRNMKVAGFQGDMYPVNPKYREVQGLTCFKEVDDLPAPPDLAVILTPARTIPEIVRQCGRKGVTALLILSAGFKEAGQEGQALLEEVLATARRYRMRIMGPNCFGIMHPATGINATFAARGAQPGRIAFISQSGALGASILDWAAEQNVGLSCFASIGSMVDVGFHDLIEYLSMDAQTSSILIYMESLTNARKFMSAARAYARTKPIIILKSGASEEGAQAALSHTGSVAGNDLVFDAAFRRAGVLRVNRIADLFNCAQALAMQPRPAGNRLAIVTNAGGPAVLATDRLATHGGQLAKLSPDTMAKLNATLNLHWSHNNPVDILGDGTRDQFAKAIRLCAQDPGVDAVLVLFVPQAITPAEDVAHAVVEEQKHLDKPVLASWMGEADVAQARNILDEGEVPNYRYPESAVDVFLFMNEYRKNLQLLYETPDQQPSDFQPDRASVRQIIRDQLDQGKDQLDRTAITRILEAYNIPVTHVYQAATEEEAVRAAGEAGFPVAVKISSPDISHKTDVGGVILHLRNEDEVSEAFREVTARAVQARPKARINGVTVEAMVNKRYELLIGAKQDPVFGPVIVFGMGGIAVEVFRDLQMALPPLNMALARQLVRKTRIYTLLEGYRKMPGVDLDAIYFLLIRFAYLMMDFPEITEMDLNPYSVDENGGVVLDARAAIAERPANRKQPFDHLVIPPYPSQYQRTTALPDGTPVLLRPIRPEDEPLEAGLFNRLSRESVYFRFFGYIPHVDHEFLTRFTHIDYDREMAIVAETTIEGEKALIGVVRIVGDNWNGDAEFAIVVADHWQRQGLGSEMTDFILEIARERGFSQIYATFLKANVAMEKLFRNKGFSISSEDAQTNTAALDLVRQ